MPPPYEREAFGHTLSELYLVEGLPFKQVMDIMKERYQFTPRLEEIYTRMVYLTS